MLGAAHSVPLLPSLRDAEQVYFEKRGTSEAFGEASFFTEAASKEAVMTCSVVRAIQISRASFAGLLDMYPIAGRLMLEAMMADVESRMWEELSHLSRADCLDVTRVLLGKSMLRTPRTDLLLSELSPPQLARAGLMRTAYLAVKQYHQQLDITRTSRMHDNVAKGNVLEVKIMLSQGMSPDTASMPDQRTALHIAAGEGHVGMCQLLLETGADPSLADRFGRVPLLEAAQVGAPQRTLV
eukprot:365721-Chlamydomonas_euryale.AAC.1